MQVRGPTICLERLCPSAVKSGSAYLLPHNGRAIGFSSSEFDDTAALRRSRGCACGGPKSIQVDGHRHSGLMGLAGRLRELLRSPTAFEIWLHRPTFGYSLDE